MLKASNQTLATSSHTHAAMLKKKKDGESSQPCVKKVRRKDCVEGEDGSVWLLDEAEMTKFSSQQLAAIGSESKEMVHLFALDLNNNNIPMPV